MHVVMEKTNYRLRLMDRTGVEPKRSKVTAYWNGTRDGIGPDIGQTEYITRLTSLRDSLIDQEQLYLAQALDRLRLHSLSNKNSSYRLRMNGDHVKKSTPRNLVTTVEKFRQIRPQRHQPVIFPLEGKQILEQQGQGRSASDDPGYSGGSSSTRSGKDNSVGDISTRSAPSKVEETVQANLQRLIQPTSSIPNIGRKSIKQQENLEIKPKSLHSTRGRVHKTPSRQYMSPFVSIPTPDLKNYDSPSPYQSHYPHRYPHYHHPPQLPRNYPQQHTPDVSSMTPDTQRLGYYSSTDAMDIDKLKEYCYDYYIGPSTTRSYRSIVKPVGGREEDEDEEERGEGENSSGINSTSSRKRFYKRQVPYRPGNFKKHQRHGGSNSRNGNHSNNNNNLHSNNGPHSEIDAVERENAITVYMPEPSFASSGMNGSFCSTGEDSDLEQSDAATITTRLPAIRQGESVSHTSISEIPPSDSHRNHTAPRSRRTQRTNSSDDLARNENKVTGDASTGNTHYPTNLSESQSETSRTENGLKKRRIVVDMPSIIFNAASPEFDTDLPTLSRNGGQGHIINQSQGQTPTSSLRKAVKQQELRQKELHNLLEDVKELNMRTEALSSQSMNEPT